MNFSQKLKLLIKFLWSFGIMQAKASLFAGIILSLIIFTKLFYPAEADLNRYDFMFIVAVLVQVWLIKFKHESLNEFKMIITFHILAMIMEVFKTSPQIGSWAYAPGFKIGIMGVPLFAGFMYSELVVTSPEVGVYLALSLATTLN